MSETGTGSLRTMLDQFTDSSQKTDARDANRVRLLGETSDRRLWIAAELPRRMADLCLLGGALGSTVLIASTERRPAGREDDGIGRS